VDFPKGGWTTWEAAIRERSSTTRIRRTSLDNKGVTDRAVSTIGPITLMFLLFQPVGGTD
jgi:hypothetical protein